MQKRRGDGQIENRRHTALLVVLLAGVLVGLLGAIVGVVIDDFVMGTVIALVPGLVLVAVWWKRFLK